VSALPNVHSMKRSLGDFIDYSIQPTVYLKEYKYDSKIHLDKDSCLTYKTLSNQVILSTYQFASGWECRELTRKELFNIWGLSELEDTEVPSD